MAKSRAEEQALIAKGNPEDLFQLAKHKWDNEYSFFNFQALSQIVRILSLLFMAAQKNHIEAARCYTMLFIDRLPRHMREFGPIVTFEQAQKYFKAHHKETEELIDLLDNPIFRKDEFLLQSLSILLIAIEKDIKRGFNIIMDKSPLFKARLILQAKACRNSISAIKQAFEAAEEDEQKFQQSLLYDSLSLFLLQHEEILDQLKAFTLDDVKDLLKTVPLSTEKCECEFLFLRRGRTQEETHEILKHLNDEIQKLSTSTSDTLTMTSLRKHHKEEKRCLTQIPAPIETKDDSKQTLQRTKTRTHLVTAGFHVIRFHHLSGYTGLRTVEQKNWNSLKR